MISQHFPDSKVHVAHMGPTRYLSAPGGPHVGPMNLVIRVVQLMAGGVRQQDITRGNVQPDRCRHMASLQDNEFDKLQWWLQEIKAQQINEDVPQSLQYKTRQIPTLKGFSDCLAPVFAESLEARCQVENEDVACRRCSNYIWVIENFIAYYGASYIRDFTVYVFNKMRIFLKFWELNNHYMLFCPHVLSSLQQWI